MKTFHLLGTLTYRVTVIVEADTLEEAKAKARFGTYREIVEDVEPEEYFEFDDEQPETVVEAKEQTK